jgi:hypothetical protein
VHHLARAAFGPAVVGGEGIALYFIEIEADSAFWWDRKAIPPKTIRL